MSRYMTWAGAFGIAIVAGLGFTVLTGSGETKTPNAAPQAVVTLTPEEGPIIRNAREGDLDLSMVIYPGYAGSDNLNFYMIDVDRDWKDVQRFSVRFTYLDGNLRQEYDLTQLHEGHFPLDALPLTFAGHWAVEVTVVRAEAGTARFAWDFVLGHQ